MITHMNEIYLFVPEEFSVKLHQNDIDHLLCTGDLFGLHRVRRMPGEVSD